MEQRGLAMLYTDWVQECRGVKEGAGGEPALTMNVLRVPFPKRTREKVPVRSTNPRMPRERVRPLVVEQVRGQMIKAQTQLPFSKLFNSVVILQNRTKSRVVQFRGWFIPVRLRADRAGLFCFFSYNT